ncbi:sensor histidine kinase [Flavobacterium chuncheonense]|uniref:histidine kinase n=1 Tax=Flavobacterium chuncheonense TaxID=2026653 RepID=A0ABW5YL77_9FLAO
MKRKEAELMLKTSLESEKKERQRIAADIHDGVSGDLNAIRNFISILLKTEQDVEKQEMFAEIKSGVEAALENTRIVSYKLMPPLLEKEGFIVALQDYFERLNSKNSAVFSLNFNSRYVDMTNEMAYELFRVLQEFTTNMMKYGNVSEAKVNVMDEAQALKITIQDNGTPYNFKEMYLNSKGTGLKNINSRLKVIEANLIQNEVTDGNSFLIVIRK